MRTVWVALLVLLGNSGCGGISVSRVDHTPATETLRSVFRLHRPGPATQSYLQANGIGDQFPFSPATAAMRLAETDRSYSPERLGALAELSDLAGRETELWSRGRAAEHYLDAVWYASLALSATADEKQTLTAEAFAEVQRAHNHALERFIRVTSGRRVRFDESWEKSLASRGLHVQIRRDGVVWAPEAFDEFKVAGDYAVFGLNAQRTDGLGVPLFAVRKRSWRDPDRQKGPNRFLPPFQSYPATAFVRWLPADGPGRPPALLELHDPLRYDAVAVGDRSAPLAADRTAPLVYYFTMSDLDKFTQLGFLDPQREAHKTGLILTHPYEPGKIPVVLVHGLWSSSKTWLPAINELQADPILRERYQFWTFLYPTGDPFIRSAAVLRRSLAELRQTVDPDHADPAFDQMVLVGHSMGGLLTKTMIQQSGDALWRVISDRPFAELKAPPELRAQFEEVFFFEPALSVRRAVFIAVPHRGSMLGNQWLGRIGDCIIRRPNILLEAHKSVLTQNDEGFFTRAFKEGLPSSVRLLRYHSPVVLAVDKLPYAPNVPLHSIIAQVAAGPVQMSTDGVVPYDSSHLENAVSEKIVTDGHTCLANPDVIAEIHRILLLHLEDSTLSDAAKKLP